MFFCIENKEIKQSNIGLKNVLKTYFYFNRTHDNQVTTSIELICYDLGLLDPNKSQRTYNVIESNVKKEVQKLIDTGEIQYIPVLNINDFDQIKPKSIFKIQTKFHSQLTKNNFTQLSKNEFDALINTSKNENIKLENLFNIYLFIKSYVFGTDGYCCKSQSEISEILNLSRNTVRTYINSLINNFLLIKETIRVYNCSSQALFNYRIFENELKKIEKMK